MTDRMIPAVRMPMPLGAPWNSAPITGTWPIVAVSSGCTWSPNSGANTNSPHMP